MAAYLRWPSEIDEKEVMRVLVLTTLYPNAIKPSHGIFVENRLRAVRRLGDVDLRVVAPVPWFPFTNKSFGSYADYARVPKREWRHGIEIRHPRYFLPPKVGMTYAAQSLEKCFQQAIDEQLAEGWDFDLIDAHYYYPDGVAAVTIGKSFAKPVVVTARGTDINLIPSYPKQRAMILDAASKADMSITVCKALKHEMVKLGAKGLKIRVLRNGVDLDFFKPLDRNSIRNDLGLTGPVIASVGHLIDRKGHDLVLQACAQIPDATVLIAGDGPELNSLEQQAAALNLTDRVRFLGRLSSTELVDIYNAADVLALGSDREGWPNVLLEAMACGTPCIAFDIWGCAEVIGKPEAGVIIEERNAAALAVGLKSLLAHLPSRAATRLYAEGFSWDETAHGVLDVWQQAVAKNIPEAITKKRHPTWAPIALMPSHNDDTKLFVTVDTEEIFDWQEDTPSGHSLSPIEDFIRFQKLCEAHNVKPHYFLTYPLIMDGPTSTYFKDLHQRGVATLGLHLHAWETPGDDSVVHDSHTYQSDMPRTAHKMSLKTLADAFADVFGFRANSHRAGRYGTSPLVMEDLADQGVLHDFSPSAGFDFGKTGGPDFSALSSHTFYHRTKSGRILTCVPPTGARAIRRTNKFINQTVISAGNFLPLPSWQKRLTAPMRLTPEGNDVEAMKALTTSLVESGIPLLTLSFHSSSLTAGATPYVPVKKSVQELLSRIDQYLTWYRNSGFGSFTDINEFDEALNSVKQSAK